MAHDSGKGKSLNVNIEPTPVVKMVTIPLDEYNKLLEESEAAKRNVDVYEAKVAKYKDLGLITGRDIN